MKKLGILVFFLCTVPALWAAPKGYYRYPEIHGDTIFFAAEGDLWTVSIKGGTAGRLTTHLGEETNPVVSPDGKTIFFTAAYEGPQEVYTMPVEGGLPKRWTYEAGPSIAVGFKPDGQLIYATSPTLPPDSWKQLYTRELTVKKCMTYVSRKRWSSRVS